MKKAMKLDRTAFRIVSFEDKGNHVDYWLTKSVKERLAASWFLTCQAYNLPYRSDHQLDRTSFRIKKVNEE